MKRHPDLPELRAAWWALSALGKTRRRLRRDGIDDFRLEPPPRLPRSAARGVRVAMRLRRATCLERSLVMQRWLGSHGPGPDVVIGVGRRDDIFRAHAWLDGEPDGERDFQELTRIPLRDAS